MTSENNHQPEPASNEDLEFERHNVSTTDTQPYTDNEELPADSPLDESKAEELAANDVQPLSDIEKTPKMDAEETDHRIEEINRRTSIGD